MTKILLTGVTGQVGWELQRTLSTLGEVVAVGREVASTNLRMDLSQPDSIRSVIREVRPHLIVNAAAYTAVDKAESEPELAMAINGTALGIVAEEAKLLDAGVIHYSTDYVFDGTQTTPYTESDRPNPANVYGKTKLAGEMALQAIAVPHLIFRTSWVYGTRGKNFLLTMLKLAHDRETLSVVNDQIGAPTWSRAIAESTAQVLAQGLGDMNTFMERHCGIYNLTNSSVTSWHGFAQAIFELDPNQSDRKLQKLFAIPTSQYPTPAIRPAYSLLNLEKISIKFGLIMPTWQRSLALAMASLHP
jgi:dTDP-4-dehydrorhamnose reductase